VIPKQLQIGPTTYRIKTKRSDLNKAQVEMKETVSGCVIFKDQTIYLDKKQGQDQLADTLLHEVMHACLQPLFGMEEDAEEAFVRTLAPGLLDTLRRNPELVAFLMNWEMADQ
jgi:hypothetical protein